MNGCVVICLLENADMESAKETEEAPQQERIETKQLRKALEEAIQKLGEPDEQGVKRYYFGEKFSLIAVNSATQKYGAQRSAIVPSLR